MPVWITDIKMPVTEDPSRLAAYAARAAGVPASALGRVRLLRRSLDARKKSDIHFLLSVEANPEPDALRRMLSGNQKHIRDAIPIQPPQLIPGNAEPKGRIVVAGLGPAGLFGAYLLSKYGYRPLVIERGKPIDQRAADVENRWSGGPLNPESNVMFGEGGAGTFSDGKLTSRSKDPRVEQVFQLFRSCGASEDILVDAKPHIGTDRLRTVVQNLRMQISAMGGEVRFQTKLSGLEIQDGKLASVSVSSKTGTERIPCCALLLATGQGARDTVRMLLSHGVAMEKKPFAVGLRIEHPQAWLNQAQYGALAGHSNLGAADYRLTAQCSGRGVYTFCMCPGGVVVDSASEPGQIVVNGMSYHARDGANANAALVTQVFPQDVPDGPLGGVQFCEELERAAFRAGDGFAPVCRTADFLSNSAPHTMMGVQPSYRPSVTLCDLHSLLPGFISASLTEGIRAFGRQLKGFDDGDAVLTAVESRTSAPYRIDRDQDMESISVKGLYPVGEGAGYAGGIVSSAIDGLKAAERVIGRYRPQDAPI